MELCIILYSILTKDLATVPWEAKNFFSFITAIICSILASAVMLLLPNTNSNNSVKDLDRIVKEILKNLSDERFPVMYNDTNDPDVNFNSRLNKGIQSTKKFIYFGDRALYLTRRLGREIVYHDARLEICVFLADMREDS